MDIKIIALPRFRERKYIKKIPFLFIFKSTTRREERNENMKGGKFLHSSSSVPVTTAKSTPAFNPNLLVIPTAAQRLTAAAAAAPPPPPPPPSSVPPPTPTAKKRITTASSSSSTVAPVQEYVWQDDDGTIHQLPPSQRRYRSPEEVQCSGWWLWLIVFFFFVALILLAFVPWSHWHGDGFHHTHAPLWEGKKQQPPPPSGDAQEKMRETAANCTADETFNAELHLCVLQEQFPHAVSDVIVDRGTSPCQDIYRHACGKWMDTHHNENRGFSALAAVNDAMITQIVGGDRVPNLNAFYSSCVATLVGIVEYDPALDTKLARDAVLGRMLDAMVTLEDLPIVFARMSAMGFKVPFSLSMMSHPEDKGVIPMFAYDGFSVREDMERDWVVEHFELLHGKGSERAQRDADVVIAMVGEMNALKPANHDALESVDGWNRYMESHAFRTEDSVTWAEFSNTLMNKGRHVEYDWDIYMAELGKQTGLQRELHFSKHQTVWAMSRAYFERWRPRTYSVDQWRTFITFSVLYHTHDFFPKLPSDAFLRTPMMNMVHRPSLRKHRRLAINQAPSKRGPNTNNNRRKRKRGTDIPGPDELRITARDCVDASKYMLPGLVSKEFLARAFPTPAAEQAVRTRVMTMMERLRARFLRNIEETPWMDDVTKAAQKEKIATVIARVIHPNEWSEERFELGKEMDPRRYLRNLLIIQQDRVRRNLALWSESNFGAKCDSRCRDKTTPFGAPLFTVNAWYNPDRNVITLPAGILQAPFFDMRMSEASMYGRLGWVASHEFSHALDVHGINYDKYGVVRDTWSKESRERYMQRSSCLVREYPGPKGCPNPGDTADYGRQTLGENFADHNGVRLAFEALFIDGNVTGADRSTRAQQEFFMAAAQMWCSVMDTEHTCESAKLDVHSSADFRVRTTFSHLSYYGNAFACRPGQAMNKFEQDRCVVLGSEAREYAAIARLKRMEGKK